MTQNFDLGIDDQQAFIEASRQFSIGDLLAKRARMTPEAVAVQVPDRAITYAQLQRRVYQLANALLERGHTPEESTFAIVSENRPEFVEVLYAGAVLGCLVAAQNWRLEEPELVHCIDTVDPDVVFVTERHDETRSWIEDESQSSPEFVLLDGTDAQAENTVGYEDLLETGDPTEPLPDRSIDPEQGFVVMYTSGTTGMPKGAVVSHRAEFARTNQVIVDYGLETGDSYPSWAPMFHMGGIDWVITMAVLGGTYYPIDGFDADRLIEVLQTAESPLAWLILFPGMADRFLEALEEASKQPAAYQDLRAVGALLDLMNPETIARITEILDAPAQNTYGATETGHVTSGRQIPPGVEPTGEMLHKTESPFIQIQLLDESNDPVGPGNRGEVAVRGPPVFSGYINAPEANREEFVDGWFATGDIMELHQDGSYSYASRRKYMIKPGGENVYPAEIENVLVELDLIEDVCVVRAPDDKWGEVPRAIIGTDSPAAIDREELLEVLAAELANYKLPHYIEFVDPDEFPRSTTGKIQREQLEDWPLDEDDRVRTV